jgi:hypothetical protein
MLSQADVSAHMPQLQFEKFYQKLITEIQELEGRVEAKMRPREYYRGSGNGPVCGPSLNDLSLNGWMYLINKQMDKRAALHKQLEYLEQNPDMNWAVLWDRLKKELPDE